MLTYYYYYSYAIFWILLKNVKHFQKVDPITPLLNLEIFRLIHDVVKNWITLNLKKDFSKTILVLRDSLLLTVNFVEEQ